MTRPNVGGPPPRKTPTAEELRRRVTGTATTVAPPQRQAAPTTPLPPGRLMTIEDDQLVPVDPTTLTAGRRAEAAAAEEAARREAHYDLPLPVDPRTPPLQVKTVDVSNLTPAERAARLARATPETRQLIEERLRRTGPGPAAVEPEVVDDLAAYEQVMKKVPPAERPFPPAPARPAPPARRPDLGGTPPPEPAPEPAPGPVPAAEPEPAASAEPEPAELGAMQTLTECPHCKWPLDMADVPEPDYADKMTFLHAVLGQRPYQKAYGLFGDAVHLVVRTLTTQEIDACYTQAFDEKNRGLILTQPDFWERINRLRLCLQLVAVRSDQFQHDLPDGLAPDTSPYATSYWSDCNLPAASNPTDRGLVAIEQWLLANVLRTESFNRVVALTMQRFNRLVARLEALVDNSDFWRATEAPS